MSDPVQRVCGPQCWTALPCPTCGAPLAPAGRSMPMEMSGGACCEAARHSRYNTRHLWDEHDSTRHYTDPQGWAEHVATCAHCGRED